MGIRINLENSISDIVQKINKTPQDKLDKLVYYSSKLAVFEDTLLMYDMPEIESLLERIECLELIMTEKIPVMNEAYLRGQLDAYKTILDLERN